MAESVAGSIFGATIQIVIQNLLSICVEDISLIRNLKKDLEKLKNSFLIIQDFLDDAERQQVTNKAVKRWLNNLEVVAFDADDVLDELNYEVLCKKTETQNKMKKKVQSLFSTRKMARRIRDINDNLKLINQEAMGFGLQRHVGGHALSVGFEKLAERETDSYSVDPIVFGRENDVSKMVEILTSSSQTHDEQVVFSVLPIIGMGGLGKTTLARQVFHDEKIETLFDKLIWVYVSEKFDDKALFKKILESLTRQKADLETKDALLGKLQENLEAKKYLLVLDDVWIEETKKWGDFIDTLSSVSSVKGNGIIVTTRSEKVASIVGTIRIPKLSQLADEDCWSIIKEKSLKKGCVVPSEFETTGKKIAKRCHGLPLAAKVLAGLLHGKSKEEWEAIEEARLSNLGEDGNTVMKILKLSFDDLPSQTLKKCFAFCSIFPKGIFIQREMLIYLWMSEGFLQSDQGNDMETMGYRYFDLLLQKSLLQVVERDGRGNIKYCNMHDLVHDLACSILDEAGPVRYIYMKSITDISKEEARNLRSLIFDGQVSDNMMFSDFKCLRGLVLIDDGVEQLPKIDHLVHLRFLDIVHTVIECLPKSIGNLYHMQTLRANNGLKELPKTLKKLIKLRHLRIHKSKLPYQHDGIINEEIPMLGHLPHLKSLYLENLPYVRSIGSSCNGIHDNGVGKETIIAFPALERLSLSSMSSMTELLTAGETQLGREVTAFQRLEYLRLLYCQKLTSASSHFPCLKELVIYGMDTNLLLENILVNLTSLARLTIAAVEGLVCLPDVCFCKNQNLLFLSIRHCHNLTQLAPHFGGASLREIEIIDCRKLEELPENLHCLNSLAKLLIVDCPNLKSIPYNPSEEEDKSVQGFPSLRDLRLSRCGGLIELPSGMLESATLSLETMYLSGLSSLTNMAMVIGCLHKMPHLTALLLDFRNIPELANNNFPIEIGSFRSLRDLSISCGMENWDRLQDQLQHLSALRILQLDSLEIEAMPEWLGKLSSLEALVLTGCKRLTSLPSKEALKRLTKLWIYYCPLLNLRSDDDDSVWHKISHIVNVRVHT